MSKDAEQNAARQMGFPPPRDPLRDALGIQYLCNALSAYMQPRTHTSPRPPVNLQHMHTHWCTLPSAHAHQHAIGRIVVQDGLPRMQTLDPLDLTPIRFVTSPFVMMLMTISARDAPFWSM